MGVEEGKAGGEEELIAEGLADLVDEVGVVGGGAVAEGEEGEEKSGVGMAGEGIGGGAGDKAVGVPERFEDEGDFVGLPLGALDQDAKGVGAEEGVGVVGGSRQEGGREGTEALEEPEGGGLQGEVCGAVLPGLEEGVDEGGVGLVGEGVEDGEAVGEAGVAELKDFVGEREGGEGGAGAEEGLAVGAEFDDAPEAAALAVAAGVVEGDFDVGDDAVVEVGDVEGAVGAELDVDGAEPGVAGLEEVRHFDGDFGGAVEGDAVAVDAAGDDVAEEEIALEVRWPEGVFAGDEAGDGGGAVVVVEHWGGVAEAVVGLAEDGVEAAVDILVDGHGVAIGGEEIAEGVEAETEDVGLAVAEFFDAGAVRAEAEGAAAHGEGLAAAAAEGGLIADALAGVDPAVEAAAEIIDHVVGIVDGEGAEDAFLVVSAAVAVGVREVDDVGSGENEGALAVGGDGIGEREAVGEEVVGGGGAVGLELGEDADGVARSFGWGEGVAAGFRDPELARRVEAHGDGFSDVGLGGYELDREALGEGKGLGFLGRGEPGGGADHFREGVGGGGGGGEAEREEVGRAEHGGGGRVPLGGGFVKSSQKRVRGG